ncbi:FAD-binding oxidoreductase [Mesorhizobium sp. L-2-11]|uniref:FAD-binding oxidoreductase n=1 Tax=Mesorhizobium sp. L-2-11 TaxID=2744521 RepID=UPI0019276A6E|nr:FAD-binding oxidoreductase [Mesorhizobium sp. L-2-11]BCH19837.1 hypothetical protein MesoLjLa_66880 [Mesorhizobium sp. L-2-11]
MAYSHLARDLLSVFPGLCTVPVIHCEDGLIGYTYDEVPDLGRTHNGIYYAIGYCGTGVSRAKVAPLMEAPDGATAFDDIIFPVFPVHPIAKRAVPFVEKWARRVVLCCNFFRQAPACRDGS